MGTEMHKHKRKLSSDLSSTTTPGKSPKRGRFSSLFGLSFFEYDHGQQQQQESLSSSLSSALSACRGPKAPPTCTVSFETAGVLEDVTNLKMVTSTSTQVLSPPSPPSPTTPSPTAARFRCSASSTQSLFKGHHTRARSFSVYQDDVVPSNLRKRGDAKLVAMVRRTLAAHPSGMDGQEVILSRRLSGYLDQWGWRERGEDTVTDDDSVFDMDVDEDESVMEVDRSTTPRTPRGSMSTPRPVREHSNALTLEQVVATLTLKHRDRPSCGSRLKERSTSEHEAPQTVTATRNSPKRSSGLRQEVA
ncbi:hypothetical protein PM082_009928 [Marasmius tenuissimus]|nr:hypothetical protein PM082_009928 [Marasmius tenuissimus]